MVKVYLQEKAKVNLLNFQVITGKNKGKLSPLIEKKEWRTTLISEEMTCYLYIDKESSDYNFHSLYDCFVNFSSSNERDWNIDIQTFISKQLGEEEVIQAISEGILFGSHQFI